MRYKGIRGQARYKYFGSSGPSNHLPVAFPKVDLGNTLDNTSALRVHWHTLASYNMDHHGPAPSSIHGDNGLPTVRIQGTTT